MQGNSNACKRIFNPNIWPASWAENGNCLFSYFCHFLAVEDYCILCLCLYKTYKHLVILHWHIIRENMPYFQHHLEQSNASLSTGISRYPCFSRISPKICHIISYHWSPGLTELILSHPGIFPLLIIVQYEKNTGNNIPTL